MSNEIEVVEVNEITNAIKASDVETSTALQLQSSFDPLFRQAKEWAERAKEICVTDATQVSEMKKARELRLNLRSVRVEADKVRKRLKEDSLRYGKAVQGVYNVIEFLIVPIEEKLERDEKFAELAEKKRLQDLQEKRFAEYAEFQQYLPCTEFSGMKQEQFETMVENAKIIKKCAEEKALREKEEAEAKAKAEQEERERIRLENERLKKQAEEERSKAEKERAEMQKKLDAERKERERIEAEQKAKAEKERAEKERIEAEERKKAGAPDREKMLILATLIDGIKCEGLTSKEANELMQKVSVLLSKTANYIRENISNI